MTINSISKNTALYLMGIALSCGPSQIYGTIKGAFDLRRYAALRNQIQQYEEINSLYCSKKFADLSKTKTFQILQRQLPQLSEKEICDELHKKTQELIFDLNEEQKIVISSLKTDAVALAPFIGALCAWRLNAGEHGTRLSCFPSCEFSTAHALNGMQSTLQKFLYPLSGMSLNEYLESQKRNIPLCTQNRISIPVPSRRGQILDALFLPGKNADPKGAAIVLFHGNGMICHDFMSHIRYFQQLGFNVLAPTIGGYPGSPGVDTSEASTYQDVEAIKLYLKHHGITQAGYYGLSIGGTLAFQAGTGESESQVQTLFVIADQTFESGKLVMENAIREEEQSKALIKSTIQSTLPHLARGVSIAALPHKKVRLSNQLTIQTDGLNNARKAAALKEKNIPLFAIKSAQDEIMGWNFNSETKSYQNNFAEKLLNTRYGNEINQHLLEIPGAHCELYFFETKEGKERISRFLADFST